MISRRGFFASIFGGAVAAIAAPFLPRLEVGASVLDAAPLTGSTITVSGLSAQEFFQVGDIFTVGDSPTRFIITDITDGLVTSKRRSEYAPRIPRPGLVKNKISPPRRWHPPVSRSRYQRKLSA